MLRNLRLACVVLAVALCQAAFAEHQVRPDGIVAGNARFQPLSAGLLRMEYSPDGTFVDTPSAVVANRLKPIEAKVSERYGKLIVETKAYRLEYKLGSGKFTAKNLRVEWRGGKWVPGQIDLKNLGGTPGALDGVDGTNLPVLGQGVLSLAGYWLLDDSATPVFDKEGKWITPRKKGGADQYLFIYGDDYKGALKEYAKLLGQSPLIPRYALGCWYSRYWDYTDQELKDIVEGFRSRKIPLDVLVVDVDWHKYGWEGYDWNTKSFPDPKGFLKWCRDAGLEVTLNNHPSISPAEDSHTPAVRKMLGLPEKAEEVRFNLADQKHAEAYNQVLHNPFLDDGVSFWWIDGDSAYMDGLNSRLWTNRVYYAGQEEYTGKRSLIFSRYGGTGSHRYPLGFSGDTIACWEVLQYEAGMTASGSNVLWQWSHDIGGFHGDKLEEELMARWTQFGAFAPVLRLHSNHGQRLPWDYEPRTEKIMGEALRLRESLIPYLYSLQHDFTENALPVHRPLYLEYRANGNEYQHPYEFLVGPKLLVAPACAPTKNGVTDVQVFLPRGKWLDYFTGRVFEGDRTFLHPATLEDTPVFAKGGAIVPTQADKLYDAQTGVDDTLTLRVYRGGTSTFELVEDDGLSLDYRKGEVARTKLSNLNDDDKMTFLISPRQGDYEGAPSERSFDLLVFGLTRPRSVKLNGKPVEWTAVAGGAVKISLGKHPVTESLEVRIDNPGGFAAWSFATRAHALAARLAGLSEVPAAAALAAKLNDEAGMALAGTKKPYDLGRALLKLVADARKNGAKDSVIARIVDFRTSGGLELTQPFGFGDTVAACASWDQNLPAAGLETALAVPAEYKTEKATPRGSAFNRWRLSETSASEKGDFRMVLTWTAELPGGALSKTERFRWSNAFVTDWKLVGPFPAMIPTAEPPIFAGAEIDFGKKWTTVDGERAWTELSAKDRTWKLMEARVIDFRKLWWQEKVHGYAATYLYSPDDREVRIDVGADDTFCVWVNRSVVGKSDELRAVKAGDVKFPVKLKKGWNEVVVRVGDNGGQWGFCLEVKKPDGTAETEVKASTSR